ncbi:MAG: hypothetical protein U5L95_00170 [Candidatus Saccharibacteria bacterium]|nr:hypothetical protein [Candidatus Saccharibacteria bacterium]
MSVHKSAERYLKSLDRFDAATEKYEHSSELAEQGRLLNKLGVLGRFATLQIAAVRLQAAEEGFAMSVEGLSVAQQVDAFLYEDQAKEILET